MVALAARRGGVKRFLLIPTDKAVRPVGVVGMSKWVAGYLVLSLNGGPSIFGSLRYTS